ncbi:MAG: DUF3575 domain-containing protein [Pyrinomonadaceae bacterium]|nr:DUF3575 domain-containing protein [Sphingobacteriaceae bacterium]
MKNVLFLFVLLSLFQSPVFSQNSKFAISTNLLNLAAKGPSVALSYKATPHLSYQIYVSQGRLTENYNFKTALIEMKYAFWDFMYVGPYLRYIEKRVQREGITDNTGLFSTPDRNFYGQGISSGLTLGIKPIESDKLMVECFAGLGYGRFVKQIDYDNPKDRRSAFPDARVGLLVGFKW